MTRTKRITCIMAVMLCVAAFLFPMTAYAASDTEAPTVRAWIDGESLHIEAVDKQSGVEAVYINDSRINYRVDNALDIPLRDYAGSDEYISIYAIDFAGNKSNVVLLKNPSYTPATATTPATTPTQEPSESSVPDAQQPFTPDGTGTVVDDIMETNGKEFLTITTPDGNVFYLIIDRARDENGVYLLNAVTEDDLMSLAKEGDGKGTSESAVPTPEPTPSQAEPTPTPEPTPEEPAKDSGGGTGTIILILLAVAAVGGAGYYIKIYRPKQQAAEPEDMDEDEVDFEDEPEESEDGEDEDAGEEPNEDTGDDYEDE